MQIRLLGSILVVLCLAVVANGQATLCERKTKRAAVAQQFSPGQTSRIPGTTQIVSHQRKISDSELV